MWFWIVEGALGLARGLGKHASVVVWAVVAGCWVSVVFPSNVANVENPSKGQVWNVSKCAGFTSYLKGIGSYLPSTTAWMSQVSMRKSWSGDLFRVGECNRLSDVLESHTGHVRE